ncbi:collagenase-like [Bombyx mandarina]|uniref:Collagenase-like n=1 Tax=Bombyx mandarina TaxID=7092 RepID=A0A6J2KJC1_BOMMA|nr:collagenase-like [Bombyx mandarina]
MKDLTLLALFTAASVARAYVPVETDYHEEVGIPLAMAIKCTEEGVDFDGARIVGGSVAGVGTHPHLAGMLITLTDGRTSICCASLLSPTRSVTAAHCWRTMTLQGRQLTLAFGTTELFFGGFRVTTNNVQVHPNFVPRNLRNDVAMIIHGRVTYTNVIQPIFLPSGHLLNNQFVGTWAWAAGYGRISDDFSVSNTRKNQVPLQVITNAACAQVYAANNILPSTFCVNTAGGRGTCLGNSGGPLAFTYAGRRTLIGITSFVGRTCQAGQPAGFARVTSFASWIQARL